MKWLALPRYVLFGLIALFIAYGCSHGSSSPTTPGAGELPRDPAGGTIFLGQFEQSGGELVVPVRFRDAVDLYAMSFRIGFDPSGLEPLRVDWGSRVEGEDSTFCLMDRPDFIPMAFSRFSIGRGLDGEGTLCMLRFRIINHDRAAPWIINNPEFLVARNSLGEHLTLKVGGDSQ